MSRNTQSPLFSCASIILAVYASLPFADFMAMAQLTTLCRSLARREFGNRATNIIGPFLTGFGADFKRKRVYFYNMCSVLVATQSVILGSTVLALLTLAGTQPIPAIHNLNIMAPSTALSRWRIFLQQELAFTYVGESSASDHLASTCVSLHVFTKTGSRVLLTITRPRSLLRAVVASNATSQMNLFTGRVVLSLFPELTMRRQSFLAWPAVASDAETFEALTDAGRREPLHGIVTTAFYGVSRLSVTTLCVDRNITSVLEHIQYLIESALFALVLDAPSVPRYSNRHPTYVATLTMQGILLEHQYEIADYLDIHGLVRLGHTGPITRSTSQAVLSHRVDQALSPYFGTDIEAFWEALRPGRGAVNGSVPLWVSTSKPQWLPGDLNVLVCRGGWHPLHAFFLEQRFSLHPIPKRPVSLAQVHNATHVQSVNTGTNFYAYANPDETLFITVTEAQEQHIFHILLSAQHSLQTMLLTASTLVALHPSDLAKRVGYFRAGADYPDTEHRRLVKRFRKMGFQLYVTNVDRGTPCGVTCIGLHRRLRGGSGIGLVRWQESAQEDPLARDLYAPQSLSSTIYHMGWSFSKPCENIQCPYIGVFASTIVPRPAMLAEEDIRRTQDGIYGASPAFPAIFSALLFAVGRKDAVVVPLPLDYTVMAYEYPEQLRTFEWLGLNVSGSVMPDVAGYTTNFNPHTWLLAASRRSCYRVWFQTLWMDSMANLGLCTSEEERELNSEYPRPVIHGDVLVVKERNSRIEDLREQDIPIVRSAIMKWWQKEGFERAEEALAPLLDIM
ncbi:hypothetical protein C8R44DRAFT_878201 [Mycena epipterygia]|nr:hypothetical protein C8R44DRAFT_878201 [Mycena epipterygia]